MTQPPRLLVSVRNPVEAVTALRHGAGAIDVKEPLRGPLGRPTPEVAEEVAQVVGGKLPVSVALGELADLKIQSYMPMLCRSRVEFAKIGLAGAGAQPNWWRAWRQAWSGLPEHVRRVGVVYVDWQAAGAPDPTEAMGVFADGGCGAVLFDTFTKDGRSLVELASRGELSEWTQAARAAAPLLVLAGSLTADMLGGVRDYGPDYLAVRGGVCRGGRSGGVSGRRIRRFCAAIKRAFGPITTAGRG